MPVLWHLVSFLSCTWIFCFCLDVHKPGLLHTVYVSEVCAYCPSEMCQHNKTTLDQIPQGVKGRKCRKAWEGLVAMSRLDEELQVTGSTALQWGNRLSCVPLRQEKQWVLCGALIGCPMQPLMDFGLFSCTINRYSGVFFSCDTDNLCNYLCHQRRWLHLANLPILWTWVDLPSLLHHH